MRYQNVAVSDEQCRIARARNLPARIAADHLPRAAHALVVICHDRDVHAALAPGSRASAAPLRIMFAAKLRTWAAAPDAAQAPAFWA